MTFATLMLFMHSGCTEDNNTADTSAADMAVSADTQGAGGALPKAALAARVPKAAPAARVRRWCWWCGCRRWRWWCRCRRWRWRRGWPGGAGAEGGAGGAGAEGGAGGAGAEGGAGGAGAEGGAGGAGGGNAMRQMLEPGLTEYRWNQNVDGNVIERLYRINVPEAYDQGRDYPVIFFLHGRGGTGANFARQHRQYFQGEGDFIAVYPDGHNNRWNMTDAEPGLADDVGFFETMIDHLDGLQNVDRERRFVWGSSNGAGMAQRLAVETRYFKAIAAGHPALYGQRAECGSGYRRCISAPDSW